MKITFVLPYAGLQGGIRVVAIHAERLQRRGYKVVIISTPQQFSGRYTLKSLLSGRGWPRPEPSCLSEVDVEHHVLDSNRSVRDADVPDADVIVATYYTTAPGVLALSPRKGAKAIFIQGYEVEKGKHNAALDASWRMPFHKILISKWLIDHARQRFGDTCVSYVPNGVDHDQFFAAPRGKQRIPTVGLLYSTSPLKGLSTSIEALERLEAALPSLRIVSFSAEHRNLRLRLPRTAEFHFRPSRATLRELYTQCDLWICGSRVEGFHLPPLEAMACRCPVVSTRVGWSMEAIADGVNGYLVNVDDATRLADRAQSVLTLPEDSWRQMSDSAHMTASRFSWDDSADAMAAALATTLARARANGMADG